MEKDIDCVIKKYLKQGVNIETLQESFFKVVNKYEKKRPACKTKKSRKKICRPVLLISDSSCDEFEKR